MGGGEREEIRGGKKNKKRRKRKRKKISQGRGKGVVEIR